MINNSTNLITSDISKEFNSILDMDSIITHYQPIVSLINGEVLGYEALTRGPEDSVLRNPEKLFDTAHKLNKSLELELLCRTKALRNSKSLSKDKLLFINVDPNIFKDESFKKGLTKEILNGENISTENIIFEITEKTCIEDYKIFKKALFNYLDQGYKIAIDDMGSGYSGLKMLSETRPHYVKIDMDLVRNINEDLFKQSLIECFVKLAQITNMKLIAEGIETQEELQTLISLGVYAGQGFFLGLPSPEIIDIDLKIKNYISESNRMKASTFSGIPNNYIGEIVRIDKPFSPNTLCKDLKSYLDSNEITGAAIVKDSIPLGLVMKNSLDSFLATQFGVAVFSKRPVSLVMDTNPLIVDYFTPVGEVSRIAMARKNDTIYDYIIVTKNSRYYGVVTIQSLLNFTTKIEYNYARQLNPLTALPGNGVIEKVISDFILSNSCCCMLYFDLDNFKVYNDTYGFENGDKIIKFTARLIEDEAYKLSPQGPFVGHIGGDDFVCIVQQPYEDCTSLCKRIIERFDKEILDFFSDEHKSDGYIESIDRKGNHERFSLASLSIAGLYGRIGALNNPEDVGVYVASVKKNVKKIKGSCFLINKL
ncbi:GGDEF domain-containing protein [Clostridium paridis]|uniref:GGDEF domain-containing protein n=1 Tax=Clostridium paridis TaxID=2803863 RepID=A0A937FFF5_9CLOT|nr:GGDEF domain-containing protein [Clostridium paridis]MBL4931307.1 GGDEF domain-containing protein [Clostridium paridis]